MRLYQAVNLVLRLAASAEKRVIATGNKEAIAQVYEAMSQVISFVRPYFVDKIDAPSRD